MKEEAITFGRHCGLVGVVTSPDDAESKHINTAVVFLNAGIVHRVGAGRVYVKLARALASTGFIALRFDFSGIGDSVIRGDNLTFAKSAIAETREAMDLLTTRRGIRDFILLGGCSGARIAFDTACSDPRVSGALLINFPFGEEDHESEHPDAVHRRAFFYYRTTALFNVRSWLRLATGQADYRQLLRSLWGATKRRIAVKESASQAEKHFRAEMRSLVDREVHMSFICSAGDSRLDELRIAGGRELKRLCAQRKLALHIIKGSDHTFSSLRDQEQLIKVVLKQAHTMVPTVKVAADQGFIPDAIEAVAINYSSDSIF